MTIEEEVQQIEAYAANDFVALEKKCSDLFKNLLDEENYFWEIENTIRDLGGQNHIEKISRFFEVFETIGVFIENRELLHSNLTKLKKLERLIHTQEIAKERK